VRAGAASGQVLLSAQARGLVVRAEEGVNVNGRPEGQEAVAPAGAQVKIGDVTFTFGTVEAGSS
jgi:hypothetical protein